MTTTDPLVQAVAEALHATECGCVHGPIVDDAIHSNDYQGWGVTAVAAVVPLLRAQIASKSIDAEHLAHQREWSREMFGPGARLLGVLDHIRKELAEIEADPTDLGEWVDVLILAFDGAWRAGWEPQQIIDAIKAKQSRNEARTWPDWRGRSEDEAIEHDRTEEGTS